MGGTLGPRMVLDLAFYFIVLAILRHIFFAIIVDTFGKLRELKFERDQHANNSCFICSIDRHDFDKLVSPGVSNGFAFHRSVTHNTLHYLYYIISIWQSPERDDNGIEMYVRRCLRSGDISWFPIGVSGDGHGHGGHGGHGHGGHSGGHGGGHGHSAAPAITNLTKTNSDSSHHGSHHSTQPEHDVGNQMIKIQKQLNKIMDSAETSSKGFGFGSNGDALQSIREEDENEVDTFSPLTPIGRISTKNTSSKSNLSGGGSGSSNKQVITATINDLSTKVTNVSDVLSQILSKLNQYEDDKKAVKETESKREKELDKLLEREKEREREKKIMKKKKRIESASKTDISDSGDGDANKKTNRSSNARIAAGMGMRGPSLKLFDNTIRPDEDITKPADSALPLNSPTTATTIENAVPVSRQPVQNVSLGSPNGGRKLLINSKSMDSNNSVDERANSDDENDEK